MIQINIITRGDVDSARYFILGSLDWKGIKLDRTLLFQAGSIPGGVFSADSVGKIVGMPDSSAKEDVTIASWIIGTALPQAVRDRIKTKPRILESFKRILLIPGGLWF